MNTILAIYLRKSEWAGKHLSTIYYIPNTALLIDETSLNDSVWLDGKYVIYCFNINHNTHCALYSI